MTTVAMTMTDDSKRLVDAAQKAAPKAQAAFSGVLSAALAVGEGFLIEGVVTGRWGVLGRHNESGLAGSIFGWMADPGIPLGFLGVPADSPAAAYAGQLNTGGLIRPRVAKALAVPISPEARQYTSPRQMGNLVMIKRPGRPPLLVEHLTGKGFRGAQTRIHWVLLYSVLTPAFHWFDAGTQQALPEMTEAAQAKIDSYGHTFKGG